MTTSMDDSGHPRAALSPETVHEILVAWQAGHLGWRRAADFVGVPGLPELYDAAHSSGVPIRKSLLPREKRAAERAVAAIRRRLSREEVAEEPADG